MRLSATPDPDYEPTGPLPDTRMALEASAGTGKTHALAGLAIRYLAETDLSTSELLVVTFTRAATGELRARVREMLVAVAGQLSGGPPAPSTSELAEHLASADRATRLERLDRAIAEFDAATITTIHGFARQARSLLGVAADVDPEARLVDDTELIVDAACSDVLAAAAAAADGKPGAELPPLRRLVAATGQALRLPDVRLVPNEGECGVSDADRVLRALVGRSIEEVAARRTRGGTVGFDDILSQLADALDGPRAPAVVGALRGRYRVALIDEFQDTDPVQWRIFSRLFGGPGSGTTLVTVGDPKQAIFGFRGADVHTYLAAVGEGSGATRRSLTVNWRSDGAVLDALEALFDGVAFGEQDIPFVPVRPAPDRRDRRMLHSGSPLSPLVIRPLTDPGIRRNENGTVRVDEAAPAVSRDLVSYLLDLLEHAEIPEGESGRRAMRPSDVAVLVSTGRQGEEVLADLRDAGIPAVLTAGRLNVLDTPAAEQLRLLLDAMAWPSDTRRARPSPPRGSSAGARRRSRPRPSRAMRPAASSPAGRTACADGRTCWPSGAWPTCSARSGRRPGWRRRCSPVGTGTETSPISAIWSSCCTAGRRTAWPRSPACAPHWTPGGRQRSTPTPRSPPNCCSAGSNPRTVPSR